MKAAVFGGIGKVSLQDVQNQRGLSTAIRQFITNIF
jgi:hypothetical protein